MALYFDPVLGKLVSGPRASKVTVADAGSLFTSGTVEGALQEVAGRNVQALWHYQVAAGTSGTLSAPTGGTLLLDWYVDGADALVCRTGTDSRPNYEAAYTAGGLLVTATLDSGGNWALSGTPSAYPVSIIFAYTTPIVSFNTAYALENTYVAPTGAGSGDMTKAVYDSDNDGKIDLAAGGTGAATAADARTALGVAIGTDVPALAHTHAGTTNGSKLAQANTHESADTDSATSSLHHTIGSGATNAAAGNHGHSGVYEPAQTAASQAEMEAGTEAGIRSVSPLRVAQAIAALAGGGLTNWTDAVATASPNDTVPAASLTATNAATNVDAVIAPKGTGAVLAQVPDSGTGGGNKRGTNAVDLQTSRAAASQVASGTYAHIGGGRNNAAAGAYGNVGAGWGNSAAGDYTTIAGGVSCSATDSFGTVLGGSNNAASGAYSTIGAGYYNSAGGSHSTIPGGRLAATTLYGQMAHASGQFAAAGDAQRHVLIWRNTTAGTGATELFLDGSSARAVLTAERSWFCRVRVCARDVNDASGWAEYSLIIQRTGTTTALVGSVATEIAWSGDAGLGSPTIAITADDTNEALAITVTAADADSTRWVAVADIVQVGY